LARRVRRRRAVAPAGNTGQPPSADPPQGRAPGQQQVTRPPPPGGGVQTQPLPPPPGGVAAPPQTNAPNGQRPPRGTPQPADTSPKPGDEVVVAPPSQKITNPTAIFSGLDKITGRIISFDVALNETVQFGALQVTPRACYTRPPTETPNTDAFIEVDEVTCRARSSASSPAGCLRRAPACTRSSIRSMTCGWSTAKRNRRR